MENKSVKIKNYGMCCKPCAISLWIESSKDHELNVGDLIEIQYEVAKYVKIKILELSGSWSEKEYYCKCENLIIIGAHVWNYVIAIKNPEDRYQVATNVEHSKWFVRLHLGDLVSLVHPGSSVTHKYECIIKYIGEVPELGIGLYFGLQLMECHELTFDVFKDLIHKYPECDILVTAELISQSECSQTNEVLLTLQNNHFNFVKSIDHTKLGSLKFGHAVENDKTNENIDSNRSQTYQKDLPDMDNDKHSSTINPQIKNKKEYYPLSSGNDQTKIENQDAEIKPNTIFRYDKTNIVVIDEDDIKESTKNASNINIVERTTKQKPTVQTNINNRNNQQKESDHNISSEKLSGYSENQKNRSYKDVVTGSTEPRNDQKPRHIQKTEVENFSPRTLNKIPGTDLEVGSLVVVDFTKKINRKHGVIRWIGVLNPKAEVVHVGVELEDPVETAEDGFYNGTKLFDCPNGRGLLINSSCCEKDNRFEDNGECPPSTSNANISSETQNFGKQSCETIEGPALPTKKITNNDTLEKLCGRFKGIQGHHNSCYLDATLFAMFSFTEVFDFLLFRRPEQKDSSYYEEVQKVLREEIVNPLRKTGFVRADRVMKLRQLLDKFSSGTGYTTEEKDPEELLNNLLEQVLKAEPFLKLNSGQDAFYYQLFVEKNDKIQRPTVQQLFDQSFRSSDIKLKEVPSCLIIQMPRFGKNYKMYNSILPSQILDITDIIEDSPRQCSVCDNLAEVECRDCMKECEVSLNTLYTFCNICSKKTHGSTTNRYNHVDKRQIRTPPDFTKMENCKVPRLFMELFAVVCIETSHYVAFVKTGTGNKIPWCFFDSMADRIGEQNGYNIPEMVVVPDVSNLFNEDNSYSNENELKSKHAKRFLGDAYMCMYQSTDVMMYR